MVPVQYSSGKLNNMYSCKDSLNSDQYILRNGGLSFKTYFLHRTSNYKKQKVPNLPSVPFISSSPAFPTNQVKPQYKPVYQKQQKNMKMLKNSEIAEQLPLTIVCNLRSFFPKIRNFTDDFCERGVDAGLLSEIWEQSSSPEHQYEVEKMLEMEGLQYMSLARPKGKRGGGVAIIANSRTFSLHESEIKVPGNLEVIWAYIKLKCQVQKGKAKKLALCSFYAPPQMRKKKKELLIEHIIGIWHHLLSSE